MRTHREKRSALRWPRKSATPVDRHRLDPHHAQMLDETTQVILKRNFLDRLL